MSPYPASCPPVDPEGSAPMALTIAAHDESTLVQILLDRIAALTIARAPVLDGPPMLIGFRSVASSVATLLATVTEDAFGEAEAQGTRVIAAEVSGVMPIDEGLRCWGFVSVVPTPDHPPVPRILETPRVERVSGVFTATMTVSIGSGGAGS